MQDGQTMICNNNYLADILRVCEIKDLIWAMRFQSPLVYLCILGPVAFVYQINKILKSCTVVPTKSDSDVVFCLQ